MSSVTLSSRMGPPEPWLSCNPEVLGGFRRSVPPSPRCTSPIGIQQPTHFPHSTSNCRSVSCSSSPKSHFPLLSSSIGGNSVSSDVLFCQNTKPKSGSPASLKPSSTDLLQETEMIDNFKQQLCSKSTEKCNNSDVECLPKNFSSPCDRVSGDSADLLFQFGAADKGNKNCEDSGGGGDKNVAVSSCCNNIVVVDDNSERMTCDLPNSICLSVPANKSFIIENLGCSSTSTTTPPSKCVSEDVASFSNQDSPVNEPTLSTVSVYTALEEKNLQQTPLLSGKNNLRNDRNNNESCTVDDAIKKAPTSKKTDNKRSSEHRVPVTSSVSNPLDQRLPVTSSTSNTLGHRVSTSLSASNTLDHRVPVTQSMSNPLDQRIPANNTLQHIPVTSTVSGGSVGTESTLGGSSGNEGSSSSSSSEQSKSNSGGAGDNSRSGSGKGGVPSHPPSYDPYGFEGRPLTHPQAPTNTTNFSDSDSRRGTTPPRNVVGSPRDNCRGQRHRCLFFCCCCNWWVDLLVLIVSIIAIFCLGMSLKKPFWQCGDLNEWERQQ